jgi:hypothetical protein
MLTWMLRMGKGSEQPADLAGGQRDQLDSVGQFTLITPRAYPGKLSTAAGAPFELR